MDLTPHLLGKKSGIKEITEDTNITLKKPNFYWPTKRVKYNKSIFEIKSCLIILLKSKISGHYG